MKTSPRPTTVASTAIAIVADIGRPPSPPLLLGEEAPEPEPDPVPEPEPESSGLGVSEDVPEPEPEPGGGLMLVTGGPSLEQPVASFA